MTQPMEYASSGPPKTFKPRCAVLACTCCGQTFSAERCRSQDAKYPTECEVCCRSHETPAGTLLKDEHHVRRDLQTLNKSARKRWGVSAAMREKTMERLEELLDKREVTVPSKDGPVTVDGPADENAIRACAVVAKLTEIDQKDEHLEEKNKRLDSGLATDRVSFAPVVIERPWRAGDPEQPLLPEAKEST